jgi:hypothetical protein
MPPTALLDPARALPHARGSGVDQHLGTHEDGGAVDEVDGLFNGKRRAWRRV